MKQSTCSAVICQPGGREQKHDIIITGNLFTKASRSGCIISVRKRIAHFYMWSRYRHTVCTKIELEQ